MILCFTLSIVTTISYILSVYWTGRLGRAVTIHSYWWRPRPSHHSNEVIMSAMASQIIGISIVYSTFWSGADQRKIKGPRNWPLWGEFGVDRWIPRTQRASNAENVSIWGRHHVKTSWRVNTLWLESIGHQWFPLQRESNASCFLWLWFKQTVEQTIGLPMIWDSITLMWRHGNVRFSGVRSVWLLLRGKQYLS